MARRGGALLVVLSALAWTPRAAAFPSTRSVYARGPGAEQCPDQAAVRKAVASRLGYDPFFPSSDKTIVARVLREGDLLKGQVELIDEHGAQIGRREFSAEPENARIWCARWPSRSASPSFNGPVHGYPLTLLKTSLVGPRLTFDYASQESRRSWCQLQTAYASPGTCACLPNWSDSRDDTSGCFITDPVSNQSVPIDCSKDVACSEISARVCTCNEETAATETSRRASWT